VIESGKATLVDGLICNTCKDIVDDVENHEEDTIEARVAASIHEHCQNLGWLTKTCEQVMDSVMDIIVANINENYSAVQNCQKADVC
ncbi:hypothetical protein PENTCL1PPCAC_740, partial [Pristionchus entomophagus]